MNINLIQGSNYNDTITGSSALYFEQIEGGAGNDVLNGGAITDTLNGDNDNRVTYHNATGAGVTVDFIAGTAVGMMGSNVGSDTLVNFNQVRGSNFNDTLLGSNRTDLTELFEGRAGDDYIDGRGGFDVVRYSSATTQVIVNLATGLATGAMGTDTLVGIEGVRGGSGDDILTGGNALNGVTISDGLSEVFRGEEGNDTIDGGQGYDRVDYTSSTAGVVVILNDTLDGSASDGFGGTDVLRHIEGVRGSTFNDVLTGSNSAAFESFEGREGNDTINGNGGVDRVDYQNSRAGVTVSLASGLASDGYGGTDTLSNIENVRGSRDFNDAITGSSANNKLEGLGGNDTLNGGAGADNMIGGDGSDTYFVDNIGDVVSETNAVLSTGGTDSVYSYLSAYTLGANVENGRILSSGTASLSGNALGNLLYAGAGSNVLDGGLGIDTASYQYATAGVTVSLASSVAQATVGSGSDTLLNVENLTGSNFADTLTGNASSNILNGGTGADNMTGGDGSDTYYVDNIGDVVSETNATASTGGADLVFSALSAYTLGANIENGRINTTASANLTGNALNNTLYAAAGSNVIDGGLGADTASYLYATAGVTVNLAMTTTQATGGSGSDTLLSIESLTGSNFADTLTGNTGSNYLTGVTGNDILNGGAGNDVLTGGLGADQLTGGTGADRFDFNLLTETGLTSTTWDTITDFKTSELDKIDLLNVDANIALAGDQAFIFLGAVST
ncbi:MAG: calcium-binding protein, partial [Polaromonas sp.]|nr:calcium-binding protein [Polaromonas sp.]